MSRASSSRIPRPTSSNRRSAISSSSAGAKDKTVLLDLEGRIIKPSTPTPPESEDSTGDLIPVGENPSSAVEKIPPQIDKGGLKK